MTSKEDFMKELNMSESWEDEFDGELDFDEANAQYKEKE